MSGSSASSSSGGGVGALSGDSLKMGSSLLSTKHLLVEFASNTLRPQLIHGSSNVTSGGGSSSDKKMAGGSASKSEFAQMAEILSMGGGNKAALRSTHAGHNDGGKWSNIDIKNEDAEEKGKRIENWFFSNLD